ncbi:response regulator [Nostoc sphaeroides]|uniref:DNA-binding response regulator, OmpR family, containings REC and winged-helix n=1 Tax=Nostoc sphaeroides CCNUC1 TaxID=2653204 RepID=A0A5P8WCS0_9NOSO|nr:response regulator [Nostoc sphaeroides]QFS50371.1 DNA-binding response regulator, OmpR family, containings REC and winged-helix [Nostoc sphaeroides CCNUC1]
MKILLVDDDDLLIKILTRNLATHHYVVDVVKDGEMGWTYGSTFEYDLIVLDIMLPKLDGISLCKRLRTEGYTVPILLLTAQDNITAKVQGLDAGADDYVVKPFETIELIARIRALLRRGSNNPFPLLTWGDLLLNPSTCEVTYNSRPLNLTTMEYDLLELLLRNCQHVFSTEELLDKLWSSEDFPSEATVRSHIRRVRHKLVAVGAPHDFIATMHGRGYYLKAPSTEESTTQSATPAVNNAAGDSQIAVSLKTLSDFPKYSPPDDSQQQYLSFLNETWKTTKAKSLDQMTILLQVVRDLQTNQLKPQQQAQAQQVAHKLAGTLGIFGLSKTMHTARQLEYWLGGQEPLQPKYAPLIKTLVMALQQDIEQTTLIQLSQVPNGQSPLLLIVSSDIEFNQSLEAVAASRGIRIQIAPMLENMAKALGARDSVLDSLDQNPDIILLHFPSIPSEPHTYQVNNFWELQILAQRYPGLPIVVISDRSELCDRLEAMRRGGKLFLTAPIAPEQVIDTVVNLLRGNEITKKVMILDDDQDWLHTLPTLLKPWGFQVTTLADPQQFWTILEAVSPDALILDVNMPQISGFELCQILRSDPHWQRLPVLFLSVLTDSASQNQAFTVGADDYLCKPVKGVELANRILRRLQRVKAWAS